MTNYTQIMTNKTKCSFVIPLESVRWNVVIYIKTALARKQDNVYFAAISLFENNDELQTLIKDLSISIVLGLSRFDRFGNEAEPSFSQPFVHRANRGVIMDLMTLLLDKIFDTCLHSYQKEEVKELANGITNSCETILIETLNRYMDGFFPNANNLVSVQAISSQPKSDICITIIVDP